MADLSGRRHPAVRTGPFRADPPGQGPARPLAGCPRHGQFRRAVEPCRSGFGDRRLHVHNAQVTLMRTTPEENRRCARAGSPPSSIELRPLSASSSRSKGSRRSTRRAAVSRPGGRRRTVRRAGSRRSSRPRPAIRRLPLHINDPAFAEALVEEFSESGPSAKRMPCRFAGILTPPREASQAEVNRHA